MKKIKTFFIFTLIAIITALGSKTLAYNETVPMLSNNLTPQPVILEKKSEKELNGRTIKTKTVKEVADIYGISQVDYANELSKLLKTDVKPTDSIQYLHDEYGLEPSEAMNTAVDLVKQQDPEKTVNFEKHAPLTHGSIIVLILISTALYIGLYMLKKSGKINKMQHLKIVDLVLMITFLICGLTGIMLLLIKQRHMQFFIETSTVKIIHTQSGILSVLFVIFHLIDHIMNIKAMYFTHKK